MNNQETLVREAFDEASDYLDRLMKGIDTFLDELNSSNYSRAYPLLVQIIDGLEWELTILSLVSPGTGLKLDLTSHNVLLEALKGAIERHDTVLAGDLFQYEVLPLLAEWREALRGSQFNLA
ncbi:MAG: hypothetical protein ACYC2T_04515 [Bacillota bacterium]